MSTQTIHTDSETPANRIIVPLEQERLLAMHLPMMLEKSLIEVCRANKAVSSEIGADDNLHLISEVSVYHHFLNKLAQACDSQKGGDTITSVTVRQTPERPVFILVFNRRKLNQAEAVTQYVRNLLALVQENPENLKPKPLQKRVLWRILRHHISRVEDYLQCLVYAVEDCVEDCRRNGEPEESATVQELRKLKRCAEFPCDIWTSEGSENKFLSDCETVIKAIVATMNTVLNKTIQTKAGQGNKLNVWSNLRHFMGRLRSYRQAAEAITSAKDRWPSLFHDYEVQFVPSSKPSPRPLAGLAMTSTQVIEEVFKDHDWTTFTDDIARYKELGLDEKIQTLLHSKKHRPIVHSEVLLHSHLLDLGLTRESDFFNGWKVIGTSKPLCRLCHYYFTNHRERMQVRPPHPNLYPSWRLPDVYEDQGDEAVQARAQMVDYIIFRVTQDAIKTLHDRFARFKIRDTNTYSSNPGRFESDSESSDEDDLESLAFKLRSPESSRPSPLTHSDSDSCEESGGVDGLDLNKDQK